MLIVDDVFGYFTVEKNKIITIVTISKEISAAMKGMFDMAFEEAKKIGSYEKRD